MVELDRRKLLKITLKGAAAILVPKSVLADVPTPLQEFEISNTSWRDASREVIIGNPEIFSAIDLDGFDMYSWMYKAAESAYQVPWHIPMIFHKEETTYSRDPRTYNESQSGAMQRTPKFYPISKVDEAAKDWTFLAALPQRYPDDWKEIIWGTKHLADLAGSTEEPALLGAFYKYCDKDEADIRVDMYHRWKEVFNP